MQQIYPATSAILIKFFAAIFINYALFVKFFEQI